MFTEHYLGVTEQTEGVILTVLPLVILSLIPAYMLYRFYNSIIYIGGLAEVGILN